MHRDLKSNVDVAQALPPKALTASATSAAVDVSGYDSAFVEVNFGTWTDGTHTPSLTHSADNTTYTDAGTDGVLQGTFAAVSGTAGSNTVQRVGYIGNNRYLKVVMTVATATTGALSGASIVRGHPNLAALA